MFRPVYNNGYICQFGKNFTKKKKSSNALRYLCFPQVQYNMCVGQWQPGDLYKLPSRSHWTQVWNVSIQNTSMRKTEAKRCLMQNGYFFQDLP